MFDLPWHYDTAPDLTQSLIARLRISPREPDMLVYGLRLLSALTLRAALRSYHRLKIVGREYIPAESCILVANHSSHLDALCLLSAIPLKNLHRAFPVAAQDYFFESVSRIAFSAVFINATPFARRSHTRQSLDSLRRLLAHPGSTLILFPEGTRSISGTLHDFRPGVGALIAGSQIPVIPCIAKV